MDQKLICSAADWVGWFRRAACFFYRASLNCIRMIIRMRMRRMMMMMMMMMIRMIIKMVMILKPALRWCNSAINQLSSTLFLSDGQDDDDDHHHHIFDDHHDHDD